MVANLVRAYNIINRRIIKPLSEPKANSSIGDELVNCFCYYVACGGCLFPMIEV